MIVHIATDEKFINSAYWQFNSIGEGEHIFYILLKNINEELRFVDLRKDMHLISSSVKELKEFGKSLSKVDLVCFHGLDYHSSIVLNSLPKQTKVLWILFGFEVYNNPYLHDFKKNVGTRTFNYFLLMNIKSKIKGLLKKRFRNLFYILKERTFSPYHEMLKAMKRANYCGVLYEEEFQLVKQKLGTEIEFVKFCYYPIEKMIENGDARVSGDNILLGNSASYTNNHLEAFELLSQFELNLRKVITPLSYGNEFYKTEIEKKGKNILGKNFQPVIKFMPLHVYNNYIAQCSIVVMNHYRQQAVGNVLTMIWMGAKVYLDKRSTLYHYLTRIGVSVCDISEDLIPENKEALKPLTNKEIQHNRDCLKNEISQEGLLLELKHFISNIGCL